MGGVLSEGLDFRCRLKAIVLSGRLGAILRRVVVEMVHGNFASDTSAFGPCARSRQQPIGRGIDNQFNDRRNPWGTPPPADRDEIVLSHSERKLSKKTLKENSVATMPLAPARR
jgi:hypothetical protein